VQAICDRVIIIQNGKKYLDSRIEDLQQVNRLMVETDADTDQAKAMFEGLGDIKSFELVSSDNGSFHYSLTTVVIVTSSILLHRCKDRGGEGITIILAIAGKPGS
jgi:ABC-type multidrug transport system ATPase subunit